MEKFRCRTCFKITDTKKCIGITKICYLNKTIKETIIMLVPDMTSTLADHESVCGNCLNTLKSSMKFIQRCLEVEFLNKHAKEEDQFEEYDVLSDYQDHELQENKTDLDHNVLEVDHSYYVKEEYVGFESDHENSFSQGVSIPMETLPESSTVEDEESPESPTEYLFYDSLSLYTENIEENDDSITVEDNVLSKMETEYEEDQEDDEDHANIEEDALCCATCSEIFSCEADYKLHLDIHPEVLCDTDCMNEHSDPNPMSEEAPFLCDKCPKKFGSKFKLHFHKRVVHERVKKHQCQECGKLFLTKDTYMNHYRLTHLKLKPYSCNICGLEFGRKDYLQKHIMHTEVHERHVQRKTSKRRVNTSGIILIDPGEPVVCKVCGKTYPSVHSLKAHLHSHVKVKRHQCKYCNLTFSLKGNRVRHEKLHEADPEHKFRCNICWKKMKTEEEVEQHVGTHYNRPPRYACEICGDKFHRRYLLDNHRLDKHTEPEDIEKAENEIIIKNLLEYADPRSLPQD